MQRGISATTQALSGVGATSPIAVLAIRQFSSIALESAILVSLSSGASLEFNVEVTGDDTSAAGYNPATGNWVPFTGMVGLSVSAAATLGAVVTAIRLHVTNWVSGIATFQFIQMW